MTVDRDKVNLIEESICSLQDSLLDVDPLLRDILSFGMRGYANSGSATLEEFEQSLEQMRVYIEIISPSIDRMEAAFKVKPL